MKNSLSKTQFLNMRDRGKLNFFKESLLDSTDELVEIIQYSLNKNFKTQQSKKYWEIVFRESVMRTQNLNILYKYLKDGEINILNPTLEVPINMKKLIKLSNSMTMHGTVKVLKMKYKTGEKIHKSEVIVRNQDKIQSIKMIIKISNFFNFFFKKKIVLDFINLKLYIMLNLKGYGVYCLNSHKTINQNKYNIHLRSEIYKIGLEVIKDSFIKECWFIIIHSLPISLIENFLENKKKSETINIPSKKIILSNLRKSEINSIRLAKKIAYENVQLEFYQYGAGIGNQKFLNEYNKHEIEISDRYYIWCKPDLLTTSENIKRHKSKCIQIPILKKPIKKSNFIENIVLINTSYTYYQKLDNSPVLEQVKKHFDSQVNFSKIIKKKFNNFYIKDQSYQHEKFDKMKIYKENDLISFITNINVDILSKNSLMVCSYLGTTFLELMANDIPNVLIFKPGICKNSDAFAESIQEMKKFNFIYYHEKNAANFIIKNYSNLFNLWNDEKFAECRKIFRNNFCKNSDSWQTDFCEKILN